MLQKVLITGASSGIGEAIALRLANPSVLLYITGRSEEKLISVKRKIEESGGICYYQTGDVGFTEDAQRIVQDAVKKMNGLSILIANAGVGSFKPIEEMTDEDFDKQFNTNVRGVFLFIREVIPYFKQENKGQIIVTSSNLGFQVTSRGSIYCATKHAVQAMIGCLREELRGTKIKAATVNPGSVDTPWFSDYSEKPKEHRINVQEVVDAFMLIINQGKRSNIDNILIHPTNRV
jgi:NADP-dependent 3-hydroxy acid dehydrogenase YdfG